MVAARGYGPLVKYFDLEIERQQVRLAQLKDGTLTVRLLGEDYTAEMILQLQISIGELQILRAAFAE